MNCNYERRCNYFNNSNLIKKICNICRNDYEYFFNKDNVVGIAVGNKISNGVNTFKKCITVFVIKKVSKEELNSQHIVPFVYSGVVTDVIQSGVIKTQGLTQKIRPAIGGYSVGSAIYKMTGTIGCLVTDKTSYYILGNNHIFVNENKVPLGTEILQPGRADGGKPREDGIAKLYKYIPLKFKSKAELPPNYVDCAIAKVLDKSKVSSNIALIGKPKGVTDPRVNECVMKVGRTTELTKGLITNICASIKIDYITNEAMLKNQIITTKMSEVGDSGALLVDVNNYAVGLVVASSDSISIHNPIVPVLERLNVRLVTD